MNRFLQLHLLVAYPPSNPNRDDLGRPKTAHLGNAQRLRMSSQSLKRAWRTSDLFEKALDGYVGKRTKELGREAYRALIEKDIPEKKAIDWARQVAAQFGKLAYTDLKKADTEIKKLQSELAKLDKSTQFDEYEKKRKKAKETEFARFDIEQLVHVGPEERAAIHTLAESLVGSDEGPTDEQLALLRHRQRAVDIALFGRMLASRPDYNVDAAAQVAHAIGVHKSDVEDDYFTAIDDLNDAEEDLGAGHIGERGFGAAVYYLYLCINYELLVKNLADDRTLADDAIGALTECATKIGPGGMQNSYASRCYASYVLAEKGDQQPRCLTAAFIKPIRAADTLGEAIDRLEKTCCKMDQVYGECAADRFMLNAVKGEGTLAELLNFVRAD